MKWFWRKIPLLVVITGVVGLLVYGFRPVPVTVDVITVERGSFNISVNDDGETRIREKYIVSSPVSGKLLRVELHAGDAVINGETVLAHIEPGDPSLLDARSEAEAQARVRAADASRSLADSRRIRADEALSLAKHDYDRAHSLMKKKAISRSEFERIQHTSHMAEADLRSAEFSAKVAEFEYELARAALVRTTADGADDNPQDNGASSAPRTAIVLSSPVDGRVLRVFQEHAGVVAPGTRLMELGDQRDLEMRIDVLSTEAVRIKPGARVFVDHWGGTETLEGVVRVIEPSAFVKVSALGVEERRVNIIADFRGPADCPGSLGDSFRIEARIVVDTAENIVKVPAGVLFRSSDDWYAFRNINGFAKMQKVSVGRTNGLETEIIAGLSPGDIVLLHPTDKIRDGTMIQTAR
jgi:HlyD family secretion protein